MLSRRSGTGVDLPDFLETRIEEDTLVAYPPRTDFANLRFTVISVTKDGREIAGAGERLIRGQAAESRAELHGGNGRVWYHVAEPTSEGGNQIFLWMHPALFTAHASSQPPQLIAESLGSLPRFMFPRTIFALALFSVFIVCHAADNKDERPIEPAKLASLIKQADKIIVFDSPMKDANVLFSSTTPKDVAEFNDALTVEPPKGWFHCMCIGTPAVRLYRGDTELALITNHHGRSVRCSLWTSDAMLKDPEKWLQWFDARNMPKPRKEVEDMAARARQGEVSYTRWLGAMPKSVRPLWARLTRDAISPNVKPLRAALAKEFPDTRQRILALFTWYGSGDGPWSGFPSYESAAEELLLDISTSDLIAAAQADNLTERQLEGAARLFSGWDFSQRRPDDRKTLPAALKKKLLEHSLKSTDDDKLGRAKSAFAQ